MTVAALIALGTNLGPLEQNLLEALARLDQPGTRVRARARVYRSRPVGPPQPDYLNSAALVDVDLEPLELLARLKSVEADMGRVAGERWGPRPIDLDIALFGDRQIDRPELIVPHRELAHRRFVLGPLHDLAPSAVVPGLGATVAALLQRLEDDLVVVDDRCLDRAGLGLPGL